jgi:hypothetical protein
MRSGVETLLDIDERMNAHVLKIDDDESSIGTRIEIDGEKSPRVQTQPRTEDQTSSSIKKEQEIDGETSSQVWRIDGDTDSRVDRLLENDQEMSSYVETRLDLNEETS